MERMQAFFENASEYTFLGNQGDDIIFALVVGLLTITVLRLFHYVILWRLEVLSKKTEIKLDDLLVNMVNHVHWWFYIVFSIYIGLLSLDFSTIVWRVVNGIFIVALVYQVAHIIGLVVEYVVNYKLASGSDERQANQISRVLTKIVKAVVWVIALLFVLSNLGIDITSLITGLGIGGIAVALALQTILGDLFSSFTIYFDKPFQVGDFIIVGDLMGTVESIGIKTTRLRSLHGEEIILSNQELTTAKIRNFRDTNEFRAEFEVGVAYDTSAGDLDKIKKIVSDVITSLDNVRLERVNVTGFSDSSITFTTSFYTKTDDYSTHVATIHQAHRDIKQQFDEAGIVIAFPTRVVHLEKQE